MKKLSSYLSAGIAATATLQSADAAIIVTIYGPGAQNPTSTIPTPVGINFGSGTKGFAVDIKGSKSTYFADDYKYFTSGTSIKSRKQRTYAYYGTSVAFTNGATSGSSNYANISFNGADNVYEAVGQFHFDGAGGGYLVALAIRDDNTALSISAGKTAIDAVPEPSAIALLALGAGGMAMRRRKIA